MCREIDLSNNFLLRNYENVLSEVEKYWTDKVNTEEKKNQITDYINGLKVLIEDYLSPTPISIKESFVAMYYAYYQSFIVNGEFVNYSEYFRNKNFPLDITGKCKNSVISNLLFYSFVLDDNYDNYFSDTGQEIEKGAAYTEIETKIKNVGNIGEELKNLYYKFGINELMLDMASFYMFSSKKIQSLPKNDILDYKDWFGFDLLISDLKVEIKIPGVNA